MFSSDCVSLRRSPDAFNPSTVPKAKIHPKSSGNFREILLRPPTGYVTIQFIMDRSRFAAFLGILFFLSGCAWLGFFKNTVENGENPGETAVTNSFGKASKVMDAERLKKGGKLLVVPFPAGANVAANGRCDKIALMIVKGIADELKETRFQVLDDATAHESDLIMMGHVTAVGGPGKWDKWLLRKSRNTVSIEGRMVDAVSNAPVLVFTHSAQASARREDQPQLGYDIGKDIGRFIVSAAD